ncbi:MAG: 8-amino-7-oxononanoate synthase, partial [Candidatus Omnitrophica bacterium CG11_big_fil_rev_8_21_14_0_20_63_9]
MLSALAGPDDAIVIDRLSHASLVDAARATRARLRVAAHHDPEAVAAALSRHQPARRRFVVTEGVFSMEGDLAPLAQLLDVTESHEAILVVDDAHGAFVLGRTGRGTPEACGADPARFILIGTLGKALGCQGGFVVGPKPLIELIRNRAKTFIYTTALATPVAAAAVAALGVVEQEPVHRERLRARVEALHRE